MAAVFLLLALAGASGHRLLRHPEQQRLAEGTNASVVAAEALGARLAQGSGANATGGAGAARHLPLRPNNLVEWRDEAEGCLTWCANLGDKCFRGCLDECAGALGPPPCLGFALQRSCFDACHSLEPAFACLQSVSANSTHTCHLQFNAALNLTGCPFR
mmetsp:Transcript_63081/g.195310  ORF Transcript_63081/g.195310 Transcript_63081/m.195310 type:complete len:159 (-) Transcript_63081:65-541(-)